MATSSEDRLAMLDPTIPLRFMVKRFRCRQLIPERTPLTLFAPAPPTVSYVVCDHLSPAGPAPYPCPGVDRPLRGKLPVVQHRCSSHFRFMVKHFRPFLLKPVICNMQMGQFRKSCFPHPLTRGRRTRFPSGLLTICQWNVVCHII
jgi:hypothetical protein